MTDPLPALAYDPSAAPDDQRHQALTYAHRAEWLNFSHVTPGRPSARRWVVTVDGRTRSLYRDEVMPYVTGIADARGSGHAFPVREDTPPA
jgi:hypothetical protein